jgi:predicted small lipoprotein YifL
MAAILLALAAFGMVAAGCGRRGEPERPQAAVVPGQEERKPAEDNVKTDRPFVLDPLIQ